MMQKSNFGLTGFSNYHSSDEQYDHLFKRLKEKRAEKKEARQEKKTDRKQRKEDRRSERQEKRELSSEKKRLKNELKQTQIEEKKAQLSMLNQAGVQSPPVLTSSAGGDNTAMLVAGVVGLIVVANVAYLVMRKKQAPVKLPVQ